MGMRVETLVLLVNFSVTGYLHTYFHISFNRLFISWCKYNKTS